MQKIATSQMVGFAIGLLVGSLAGVKCDCWIPAAQLSDLCGIASRRNSTSSSGRRLLWHGGGAESLVEHEELEGQNEAYSGDGGTVHPSEIDGSVAGEPGSPDAALTYSTRAEDTFYNFIEGRAKRGATSIYNYEDSWYKDLLSCTSNPGLQMCQTCGYHCNYFEWQSSGYAVLNGSELDTDNLIWLTSEVYITESVLLPVSVCVQYDWWLCLRRLDENVGGSVL